MSLECGCRILLSCSLPGYFSGLGRIAESVHSFNVWCRKRFADAGNLRFIDEFGERNVRKCVEYVERERVNVLYAQGARSLLSFVRLRWNCRRVRPKLIVTCHSPPLWDNWLRAFVFVLLACVLSDGMVFLVEKYRRKWAWLTGLARLRTYHVPNPIEVSRFAPRAFGGRLPGDRSVVLINVGTIARWKRQDMIVRIVAELVRRKFDASAKIVGEVYDRAYEASLREEAVRLGVEDRVEFVGCVDHDLVPGVLMTGDVYVCPSDAEVMPFSILEAMAAGLPVVAHDIAGIDEEVRTGENGCLVRSRDAGAYADAIADLVEANRFDAMGKAGRALAEREFDVGVYAARMKEVLAAC